MTFKVKDGYKDNNKLMSLRINEETLLETYETIWTNWRPAKYELNALPVYVDRFKKTKIRTYDKVFSNFVV